MSRTEGTNLPLDRETPTFTELAATLASLGILIGHRLISSGDENSLGLEEFAYFDNVAVRSRRQSGAARLVARNLTCALYGGSPPILKSAAGAPVWPLGIVGSLAHDDELATAAVAKQALMLTVGIDVEPIRPLPPALVEIVSTPIERLRYGNVLCQNRDLFVVKEAVYKALYAIDGLFLDFQDIEINFSDMTARASYGRTLKICRAKLESHIVALAYIAA